MRIVIEIEGNKVTVLGPDGLTKEIAADVPPEFTEGLLAEPPASLLERARKLGAMSAGAARFGTGAALAAVVATGESPKLKSASRKRGEAKRSRRR